MLDDRQGAKAIVLDFIEPVPVIEGLGLLNQGHGLRNDHETLYQRINRFSVPGQESWELALRVTS